MREAKVSDMVMFVVVGEDLTTITERWPAIIIGLSSGDRATLAVFTDVYRRMSLVRRLEGGAPRPGHHWIYADDLADLEAGEAV